MRISDWSSDVCSSDLLAARYRVFATRNLDDNLFDDAAGPLAHYQDTVGQRDRLDQIMGNEQCRLAGFGQRAAEILLQYHLGLRVQRRERLIHQQHLGVDGQRAGERRALAPAARELVRVMIAEIDGPACGTKGARATAAG